MKLYLAPMEGVVDAPMRALLSGMGGIDMCTTEFLRITDQLYPERVFYKRCPELHQQSQTATGTPVRLQLLGGKPEHIADNARKAVSLGACGIDLNFGCPAKTVNRHDGGAALLKATERIYAIVKATREAVPQEIPVTAKMRLGFDSRSGYIDNAEAIDAAGANELTVHARSKQDGYKPPAYWQHIGEIRERVKIPVIANGDIWSLADFQRCRAETGCEHFMLGRGLLSQPDLARQIKAFTSNSAQARLSWAALCKLLAEFFQASIIHCPKKHIGSKIKQWLFYLSRNYPQAAVLFSRIKTCRDAPTIAAALAQASTW